MSFNPNFAFEVSDDGIKIEGGVTFLSGSDHPSSIPATTSCVYFRSNGEIYYNIGVGGIWTQIQTSGSFNLDDVLIDYEGYALTDYEFNLITGV